MSTLRVTNIQNPSAGNPSIVLDSAGGMSGAFPSPNRNLLYNGAMQVHQRGTSATGITTGGYSTADRWASAVITLGTWTQDIQNDAPTGSGFRKSLRMLCTTADSTPAAGDFVAVRQILEGQDVQRIAKGTSFAQQLTLSFWVKSNVTGTYIVDLYDNDNNRLVSASYTVIAGATWEKKIITFPIDTVGVFDNDNAASLYVDFFLAAGSNFTSGTLQTTWATYTAANNAVGQTNLAAATNNYWQITGVQLETGAVATPFEFKSYGQELRECQRYFQMIGRGNSNYVPAFRWTAAGARCVHRMTPMRAAPILYVSNGTNHFIWYFAGSTFNSDTLLLNSSTTEEVDFYQDTTAGTAGHAGWLGGASASAYLGLNAEL